MVTTRPARGGDRVRCPGPAPARPERGAASPQPCSTSSQATFVARARDELIRIVNVLAEAFVVYQSERPPRFDRGVRSTNERLETSTPGLTVLDLAAAGMVVTPATSS